MYKPFGELSRENSCGIDAATAKFTGQEFDEETSLYYYGARYYDAVIGRFLSPDSVLPSVTDAQLLNRYSYVRNNPIVYTDPTGHFLDFIGDAARAASQAVSSMAGAIDRAAHWVSNASKETGNYFERAGKYAALIVKASVKDRANQIAFAIAVAISIATLNPAPLQIWAQGTAAAIAAQSLALAAGVRNPTVLMLIANGAALAAGSGSLGDFLKAAGAVALAIGLGYAEKEAFGAETATRLAPLNAVLAILIVNGLAKKFGSSPNQDKPRGPT